MYRSLQGFSTFEDMAADGELNIDHLITRLLEGMLVLRLKFYNVIFIVQVIYLYINLYRFKLEDVVRVRL